LRQTIANLSYGATGVVDGVGQDAELLGTSSRRPSRRGSCDGSDEPEASGGVKVTSSGVISEQSGDAPG